VFQQFELQNCLYKYPHKISVHIFRFRALYFNLIGLICILSLCCGVGLVIFAKYYACDPVRIGLIKQSDQVYTILNEEISNKRLFFFVALSSICYGNIKTI
jgi:hypothetical protein